MKKAIAIFAIAALAACGSTSTEVKADTAATTVDTAAATTVESVAPIELKKDVAVEEVK
jgi:hypothetical protein